MLFATTLFAASVAGAAIASPLSTRADDRFKAGTSWDIILNSEDVTLDALKKANGTVIDIDLYAHAKNGNIKELAKTKTVICYFSAGSKETWRDDADEFHDGDTGSPLIKNEDTGEVWKNETWVNVNSDNVRRIMKNRIEFAAASGCHAVDPDNVDGYQVNSTNLHQDGFKYPQSDYAKYVNYLAEVAKGKGLAIGLKNALDIIPDVLSSISFAVNEQCHQYKECAKYAPLTKANKAVFQIEYGGNDCSEPAGVDLSEIIKPEDEGLDTLGGKFC